MSHNFWATMPHPIFALAPMEDVTDTVFREVVLSVSVPQQLQVLFTEFCSTDGLCHPIGRDKVAHRLLVNASERALLKEKGVKLVAQVWGAHPEHFRQAVQWISNQYDFDGIDINMGCPAKKIVRQGGCSALIATPDLAKEIILATKENTHLPVSVKTRTGIKTHNTEAWLEQVYSCNPAAVTLHCRTQHDMSEGPADYQQMKVAVDLRNRMAPDIVLLANGDLFTTEMAHDLIEHSGADGAMFGRGIFHNPWLFASHGCEVTIQERIDLLLKHATLYEQTWGVGKNFAILRRFFKIYVNQLPNAALLRAKLMETVSLEQVRGVVADFIVGNGE